MADMLRDDLIQRLNKLAEKEQNSIDEIVENLLNRYETDLLDDENVPSFRLAAAAARMPSLGNTTNVTTENADDILREEFAEYLLARMNRPAIDETNSD